MYRVEVESVTQRNLLKQVAYRRVWVKVYDGRDAPRPSMIVECLGSDMKHMREAERLAKAIEGTHQSWCGLSEHILQWALEFGRKPCEDPDYDS